MGNPTTNCRIYPSDNKWILHHRQVGSTAEVITKLIRFYEHSKQQIKEGGLE